MKWILRPEQVSGKSERGPIGFPVSQRRSASRDIMEESPLGIDQAAIRSWNPTDDGSFSHQYWRLE